jgi:hypothetical protein
MTLLTHFTTYISWSLAPTAVFPLRARLVTVPQSFEPD